MSKRILSLVLALVMVLGTFGTVFAAGTTVEKDAATFLKDAKVLLGDDKGNLNLDLKLERRDVVVLLSRLMGEEEVAKVFPVSEESPTWEDARTDAYYTPFFAWAEANKYFAGKTVKELAPRDAITAQDYAVVLLRALGYEVEGAEAWKTALADAKALGILADVTVENTTVITRGQMSVMTLNALAVNVKDSTKTLAETLEIVLPTPEVLEVVSVSANNLKEVVVVFNQEVDADTVTNANVSVKANAGSVVLLEDGVTAVITLTGRLTNQNEYTVVVEKVKSAKALEIVKTEVKFKAFDATLPTVNGVVVTGPRNLTLTFSEPIDPAVVGKAVVKQDKATLGNVVAVSGNKVNVQLFTNFVEGKEYTVTVSDFKDYAGYLNVINTLTFVYEKDATLPVLTVEKVEQDHVIVSFNKPVKGLTKNSFYHTFSAWKAVNVYKDAAKTMPVSATDSVDKVYVYFYETSTDRAIPAGSTIFGILGTNIKDNWGNALGNQEFTINATADRTAPEVKELKVVTEKQLKVTFTKDVVFSASNVDVLDAAGNKISGLYVTVAKVNDKEYTINLNQNLSGKTVTVSIKDVKDTSLYQNILSLHTELVEITDKSAPLVSAVYYNLEAQATPVVGDVYSKTREIFVQFNEPVDPQTALVASNYALVYANNDVVILTEAPSFDAISSRVKVQLTKEQANRLGTEVGTAKLQVINVKDEAGNTVLPVQKGFLPVANTNNVTYTLEATGKKQIVAKFSDLLSNVNPDDFEIKVGAAVYAKTLTQMDATTTTLTFDLENEIPTNISGVTFSIIASPGIKNSYGNVATFSLTGAMVDKVKPEVLLDANKDYVVTAAPGTRDIFVTFTENMDANTFSTLSFAVEGKTVDTQLVSNNIVKLTVKTTDVAFVANEILRVSYQQKVTDAKGNDLNLSLGTVMEVKVQ